DIPNLNQYQKQDFIEKHAKQQTDTVFDLTNGPLFKASIIKLGKNEHFLTITFHHIVCDGASSNTVLSELSTIYTAYSQNLEHNLNEAPLFSDYALNKQKFYLSTSYKQIENFWVEQFKEQI